MSQPQTPYQTYEPELAYWPAEGDTPRVKAVKEAAKLLASEIVEQVPPGPHQTLALRHVEDAALRAWHGIAQEAAAKEHEKAVKTAGRKSAA